MKQVKFVTCIYANLANTRYGGRRNRGYHYITSLKSILRMTSADFTIYTSEEELEDIKREFEDYDVEVVPYSLDDIPFQPLFDRYKDYQDALTSDRCLEIQYLKIEWLKAHASTGYEYVYWIDAGLSHVGILPDKFMTHKEGPWQQSDYYSSTVFNNTFLSNLTEFSNSKFFLITKDNLNNFWSHQPDIFQNTPYDHKWHVIGGLFGGRSNLIEDYHSKFFEYAEIAATKTGRLWFEENIMTVLYYEYPELFQTKTFDTWWHENNVDARLISETVEEYLACRKPFYKVLEELQ